MLKHVYARPHLASYRLFTMHTTSMTHSPLWIIGNTQNGAFEQVTTDESQPSKLFAFSVSLQPLTQ